MKRGMWFAAGVGAGVYGMVRVNRIKEALTPDGLRDRLGGLSVGARMLRDEVAQASADREVELRDRLGLRPHGRPELASPAGRDPAPAPQIEEGHDGHS